jgi:hypothetical protein
LGVPCAAYLLTCWSASPNQVWSSGSPPFFSV